MTFLFKIFFLACHMIWKLVFHSFPNLMAFFHSSQFHTINSLKGYISWESKQKNAYIGWKTKKNFLKLCILEVTLKPLFSLELFRVPFCSFSLQRFPSILFWFIKVRIVTQRSDKFDENNKSLKLANKSDPIKLINVQNSRNIWVGDSYAKLRQPFKKMKPFLGFKNALRNVKNKSGSVLNNENWCEIE